MLGLRSLSAHVGYHIEMADAAMIKCVSLCYASDCNTLVTTPSTTSPALQVWATHSLSHNSREAGRQKASSHFFARETVSDGSTTTMTRSSLTYAAVTSDRQANTEEHQGSSGTETKYCQGKSSLTHDTLRQPSWNKTLCRCIILPASSSLSFQAIVLTDDTNSHPPFSFVFLIHCHPRSSSLLPSPNLPSSLRSTSLYLPILYLVLFFFCHVNAAAAWIRTSQSCQSQNPIQVFILSSQHGI